MKGPVTVMIKNFNRLIVFSLIIFSALNAFAQKEKFVFDKTMSPGKLKDRAKFALEGGDIYTALFYYEEVVKQTPNDLGARLKLGELHQLSRNYSKAEEAFAYVYENGFNQYPYSLYHLGISQKMSGKYEEAKDNLVKFQKEARSLLDRDFQKVLRKDIYGCDSGMVFKEFPDNVNIKNAGSSVNDPHAEFSPVFLDSTTILFGSRREEVLQFYDVEKEQDKKPLRQIYKAEKENGEWQEKGIFDDINDPEMEMGNVAYSSENDKYYFTKCKANDKGKVICNIYTAHKVRGKYKVEKLPAPVNTEGYTSTQPCVVYDTTRNTEYLYFVSDRTGGRGDMDIWYTYYNSRSGDWRDPKNARIMNSEGKDWYPFYHTPTQTFYFSSDGRISAGGFDIYKTWKNEDGRSIIPVNMSFPINSPQDDLDFHLSEDGRKGFLVSNRPGTTPFFHETCCDDIFAFEIFPPKPFEATLDLSLVTADTTCKGKYVKVAIYDLKTKELQNKYLRMKDSCNVSIPLKKNTKYTFKVEGDDFATDSVVVLTRDMSATKVIKKELNLMPEVEEEKVIEDKPVEGESFVLKDIQYDTDRFDVNDHAKKVLDSVLVPFLKKQPFEKLVISSHTDDQGSKKYNENLSQKRAEYVAKYLVEKGIPEKKIEAKGFGESKPIAPNQNPDGTDNPIGRSQNRRTEFLLIKE